MINLIKNLTTYSPKRKFSTLFLAEHNNKKLLPANYNILQAALQLKEKVNKFT